MRLQTDLRKPRNRDAVAVPKFDHCVTVSVAGDEGCQLLHGLNIGKVVKLDDVLLRIEVENGVGADPRLKDELIVAGAADRDRYGLLCGRSAAL
jgi:hypothetical protein